MRKFIKKWLPQKTKMPFCIDILFLDHIPQHILTLSKYSRPLLGKEIEIGRKTAILFGEGAIFRQIFMFFNIPYPGKPPY